MPGTPEEDHRHDSRPADLVKQREACSALLDFGEEIPDPLTVELDAYVRQLDYAMNPRVAVAPATPDDEALDAVAGILRSQEQAQAMLEGIREIVKNSGR